MLFQTDGFGQHGHGSMDPRLINAVQRQAQAAFIEGDPKENEDLELFYYHFVSHILHYQVSAKQVYAVRPNIHPTRSQQDIPQTPETIALPTDTDQSRRITQRRGKPIGPHTLALT